MISLCCKYRNGYKIKKLYLKNTKPIKILTVFFYIVYNRKKESGEGT